MATEQPAAPPVVLTVTGESGPVEGQPDRATVVAEIEAMIAAGAAAEPAAEGETPAAPDPAEGDETPAAEPEPEPKTEEPTISAARKILAAADRKERGALERETRAKALEDKARLADTMVADLLADPEAFLSRHGGGKTFEDLLEAHLSAGPKTQPTEAERIKQLEDRLARKESEEKDREQARAAAHEVAEQVRTIHTMVRDAKTGDAPRFARIAKADAAGPFKGKAFGLVTDLIVETAREGRVLTPYQAAQEIETFLAELAGDAPTSKTPAPPGGAKPTPRTASAPPNRAGTHTLLNHEIRDVPPAAKELPLDEDERRAAVEAEMRAEGLIP